MKIMRIIIILAITIGFTTNTHGQLGLELGPTAGLTSAWIINPNTLITHQELRPEVTITGEFGAQGVLKLGKRFGIGGGFSSGSHSQKYDWNTDTLSIITLETFNIPVFLRFGKVFYKELGVQLTAYNKGYLTVLDEAEQDILSTIRDNNTFIFTGLGANIPLSHSVHLVIGGRFGYGLFDIKGVSPHGYNYETLNEIAAIVNTGGDVTMHPNYSEYEEYIGYFDSAQSFADNYERFNKTRTYYFSVMASLVLNLQKKSKGSDK